jgi:hypothetical protein
LTGHIGTASAKILISSVIKEDKKAYQSTAHSRRIKRILLLIKKLTDTSTELKKISEQLKMPIRN